MAGTGAQLDRPIRPGHGAVFFNRRLRHDFKLGDADGAMAVAGADTVRTSIAAANDDDVFAVRAQLALELVSGVDLVLLRQEFHGEMDAVELAAWHGQVAGLLGAARQHDRVKILLQLRGRHCFFGPVGHFGRFGQFAHHHAGTEFDAFFFHLGHAQVDVAFFHLEIRNAITQQAADPVVLLKQSHIVAGAGELLRGSHASRAGANQGHFFAGFQLGQLRRDPALVPGPVNDGVFDGFDADSVVIHVQGAGRLAGRGADASGELGEVVGAVQNVDRVLPVALVNQVVEVRDDVVHRAAAVAKRRATVHAARSLLVGLGVVQANHKLFVIFQPFFNRFIAFFNAFKLHETCHLAHFFCP